MSQGAPTANATKVWITAAGRCYLCNNNSRIPPRTLCVQPGASKLPLAA
ncbi:MAG: hypothetical protein PUG34_05990 [Eubacteriales bacterium]|nr:hypothetical protein [Eubacteriales bacterium]